MEGKTKMSVRTVNQKPKVSAVNVILNWCKEQGVEYCDFQLMEVFRWVKVLQDMDGCYRIYVRDQRKIDWYCSDL